MIEAGTPSRAHFGLPAELRERFHDGFCHSVLWPLMHGFGARVRYSEDDWRAYVEVNELYARHASQLADPDATIWVHDFHLLLVARSLRARGHRGRIGLFVHVPFPDRDIFYAMPRGNELARAMLDFDLVGFQTRHFATNFLGCVRGKRLPQVEVFPVTIDFEPYRPYPERLALPESPEVAGLRGALGDCRMILGVDRLDHSKGIPERLEAFDRLLERYPEWRRRVVLVQLSVPSRAELPDYAELRQRVETQVAQINERFGDASWVPVRYLVRSHGHDVLAQLYRLADVALITPLRDGMNLVAKEFVVAQRSESPGVLVLSQHAGAAETLNSALITNPFHREGLAADLDHALRMPQTERVRRHRMLASALEREGDAQVWAERYLDRLMPRVSLERTGN